MATFGQYLEPDEWFEGPMNKVNAETARTTYRQHVPSNSPDETSDWVPPLSPLPGILARPMTKAELRELAWLEEQEALEEAQEHVARCWRDVDND